MNSTSNTNTNNQVWVTWKSPASGEFVADTVGELSGGAKIKDLRREFVGQQFLQISPADVKVREEENGQVLLAGTSIKQYFVPSEEEKPPSGDESKAIKKGPGQSEKTALFLTLPNVQQPQLQVSHATIWN